ncbi:fasciclin domain-containing protein [Flavihumibacter rivuli]|uniref:fasciclin domain-containing protein n=1 Tax=Flavihumibacter rivuli TaxID=2838156 RepID=UPI001BDED96A|nr:fasciclin domain-containing protein [Flavihumibacter rivuli]ULQ57972.1 fasciclin domain-containing protein [Flavihumibacter rivuli]
MRRNTFLRLFTVMGVIAMLNLSCAPSLSSLTTPSNLLGMLGGNANLSSFAGLINKVPSVGKLLGGSNPLTILAPSNDAIAALGQDAIGKLTGSKAGLKDLANILKGHIIPGKVNPADLASGTLKSIGGTPINLGNAKVVGDAINADNGTIMMIDQLLK